MQNIIKIIIYSWCNSSNVFFYLLEFTQIIVNCQNGLDGNIAHSSMFWRAMIYSN